MMKTNTTYEALRAECAALQPASSRLSFRQVRDVYFHLFQQHDEWNLDEINRKATALLTMAAAGKNQAID